VQRLVDLTRQFGLRERRRQERPVLPPMQHTKREEARAWVRLLRLILLEVLVDIKRRKREAR